MAKDVLSRINWKKFKDDETLRDLVKRKDELEAARDLVALTNGTEYFQDIISTNSLSLEDAFIIIRYAKSVSSRRDFLKTAAIITTGAAIAGTARRLSSYDSAKQEATIKSYSRLSIKGVNYDVGTRYTPTFITRAELNTAIMTRELYIIKNQLNCNAVRIYGEDIAKLVECSKIAFRYGLQVWFSPRLINSTMDETLRYIINCAREAEKLRAINPDIVFIAVNELTLDIQGFINGDTYQERGSNLAGTVIKHRLTSLFREQTFDSRLNKFLRELVAVTKNHFKGNITYASGIWEDVDWTIFDIVSINAYRNKATNNIFISYTGKLDSLKKFKKPIAVTEFGCGCYKGAESEAGFGWMNVDWSKERPEIRGNKKRDENVQASYLLDLLNLFVDKGMYAAFVWTFVEPQYTYDDNPKYDLEMASFNLIRVYPEWHEKAYIRGHVIPKKSFLAVADFYAKR